jgi:hypothetical protein
MPDTLDLPATIPVCEKCGGRRRVVGFWPHPDPKLHVRAYRCVGCGDQTEALVLASDRPGRAPSR